VSEPIATWNPARGAWETSALNLLCGHLVPFSRTWPRSGSMRNGRCFQRPEWVPATSAGESSFSDGLLPTPVAHDDGKTPEAHLAMKARMPGGPCYSITSLAVAAQTLLPTPQSHDRAGAKTPEQIAVMRERGAGVHNLNETVAHDLLPTPRASANENRQTRRTPSQEAGDRGLCLAAEVLELLPEPAESLLPTPSAADGGGRSPEPQRGPEWGTAAAWHRPGAFGRYEAAVRHHEQALGRVVPSPVQPGKTGNPQLAPAFSEWMMGLPAGWVTDVPGLSRNAQLKVIGNGVMPQQGALALALLLDRAGFAGFKEAGEAA
jgi:DNA (cytosine-5)-methyltransferase 1